MRLWILTLAVGLLVGPMAPVAAQTSCPCTVTDAYTVDADTIAVAIEVPPGGTTLLDSSTITLDGQYPFARDDLASAAVRTDGFVQAAAYTYGLARSSGGLETMVEAGGGDAPVGQTISVLGSPQLFTGASLSWIYDGIELSQGRWVLILSMPEVSTLDVSVDLRFDAEVTYERGPSTDAGLLAAPQEQDGGVQAIQGNTSAAAVRGATGQAPAGTQGYALLFGDDGSRMTGVYGIDGPGQADHTVAAVDHAPPTAFVVAGEGDYRFHQDVVLTRNAIIPGPVAVFFASPVFF